MSVAIEIYSDVICPWCFVGKRRLEAALAQLGEDARREVAVTWRPFELNPDMPKEGMDRAAYRAAKFGSLERSRELDARLRAVGAAAGIDFAFDRIGRTPNTFDAHRLIWLAQREGRGEAVVEALFRRYFLDGHDIGRRDVLTDIARNAGLDAGAAARMLDGDEGEREVRDEEREAYRMGLRGVPLFVIDGTPRIEGAQDSATIAAVLREALAASRARAGTAA